MYGDTNPSPAPAIARAAVAALLGGGGKNPVGIPTARYTELAAERLLPRTLMGGTESMRAAGTLFLPKHPAETQASYDSRINATFLYGGYAETVFRMAAKFFEEPIAMKDDVPIKMQQLALNIDGQGRALTPFTMDLVKEAMVDGIAFILVDHPKVAPDSTQADVIKAGLRPYWILVKADDVIGWQTTADSGAQLLTQVRIKETVVVPDGLFGEKIEKRVRVLFPGHFQVYTQIVNSRGESDWILSDSGDTSFDEIPLIPFYTNRCGFMEGMPPLKVLAEMNQEHWVSSSEQRRALTFLRFAMLCAIGVDGKTSTLEVGPDRVLYVPLGGDAKYVEHSGKGIESGQADLDSIEKRMTSAGMKLRIENAGQVSATASAVDSDDVNAVLKAIAKELEDVLAQAAQFTVELLGLPDGGSYDVFDDFADSGAPGTITEFNAMAVAGNISKQTLWEELRRRHMLSEDFDPETEQANLDSELQSYMKSVAQQSALVANAVPPSPTSGAAPTPVAPTPPKKSKLNIKQN
jgi:hypothetical protein